MAEVIWGNKDERLVLPTIVKYVVRVSKLWYIIHLVKLQKIKGETPPFLQILDRLVYHIKPMALSLKFSVV